MTSANHRWVVTGTDTGIGKTTVTRGVLRALTNRRINVRPLKWIETGCTAPDGRTLLGEDGVALARAARRRNEEDLIGPIRYRLPAGPVAAARAEAVVLTAERLQRAVDAAAQDVDVLLIEGAGGALVPMTDSLLFADTCRKLANASDFVLVTRDGLGTIHQTLATFEALQRRCCRVHAVVVNQRTAHEANDETDSFGQLAHWIGKDLVLGPIPPLPGATDDQLAEAVEAIGLIERMSAVLAQR